MDEESTDSPVKKNFASGIYQKTFIAELNKAENDSKTAPKMNDDTADLNERARSNDVIDGDAADLKTSSSMKDVTVDNSDGTAVPKEGRLQTPKKQNSVPVSATWCFLNILTLIIYNVSAWITQK